MTNDKTSFIIHHDSLEILEEMTDQQAGQLLKAIYKYQTTGQISTQDQLIKILLRPFVNQFKRDNKAWNEKGILKAEKAKKGALITNLKRWHKDLWEQVEQGFMELNEAESIAKNRYSDHKRLQATTTSPKSHVSVSGSVSGSVNNNPISLNPILKNTPPTPPSEKGGVFKNIKGGNDIIGLLDESQLKKAKANCVGWDIYHLAQVYYEGRNKRKGEPRDLKACFIAWCAKYTKGKQP